MVGIGRVVIVLSGLSVGVLGACAPAPNVAVGPGIEVPADELSPLDKCMFDAGFRASDLQPARSGSNGSYSWDVPKSITWEASGGATMAAAKNCGLQFAAIEKTENELRELYARYVLERECLIGLGFDPTSPPPVEDWLASWKTGPWLPIDGVRFRALDEDVKNQCGLEMAN